MSMPRNPVQSMNRSASTRSPLSSVTEAMNPSVGPQRNVRNLAFGAHHGTPLCVTTQVGGEQGGVQMQGVGDLRQRRVWARIGRMNFPARAATACRQ